MPTLKQQQALHWLREFFARTPGLATITSQSQLEDIVSALDHGLFGGLLSSRCQLTLEAAGVMQDELGLTTVVCGCHSHQQTRKVHIRIAQDHELDEDRLSSIIATVLHEMCHALIWIYINPKQFSCFESIIQNGLKGHGLLFQKVFTKCAAFLSEYGDCTIDSEEHLQPAIDEEVRERLEASRILSMTTKALPTDDRNYDALVKMWRLGPESRKLLLQLIREGRNLLELVIILVCRRSEADWRRPPSYAHASLHDETLALDFEDLRAENERAMEHPDSRHMLEESEAPSRLPVGIPNRQGTLEETL